MSDDYVQLAADGTGKKVDNESVVVGANTVYRQRTEVVGAAAAEVARVENAAPGATDYGLVVRNVPSGTQPVSSTDGAQVAVGATTDAEASAGNGSLVALLKRLRTLLNGGLPAALAANGGLKVEGVASGTAVPVSGTVTGNQGTANSTANAWPAKVTDGTNVAAVKAASTAVAAADPALAVGIHPSSALPTGANVIGALTANQSTNQAQVAGTATSVNNGTVDAGTQRVTLASNSTGQVALAAGAATIGALTANQSVNNAQLGGAAVAVDTGISSTGTQRVIIAGAATANILVGFQAQTATTAATTIITIPANRTWVGTINVSCDTTAVAASTVAGQALGTITTVGATVTPAAATVFTVEARCAANAATGTVGTQGNNTGSIPMTVAAGTSSATLALASTQAGTNSRVSASCSGVLI